MPVFFPDPEKIQKFLVDSEPKSTKILDQLLQDMRPPFETHHSITDSGMLKFDKFIDITQTTLALDPDTGMHTGEQKSFPMAGDPAEGFLSEPGTVRYRLTWMANKEKCLGNHILGMRVMIYTNLSGYGILANSPVQWQGDQTVMMSQLESVLEDDQEKINKKLADDEKHLIFDQTIEYWDLFGVTPMDVFPPDFTPGVDYGEMINVYKIIATSTEILKNPSWKTKAEIEKTQNDMMIFHQVDPGEPPLSGPPPGSDWTKAANKLHGKGISVYSLADDKNNPMKKSSIEAFTGAAGSDSGSNNDMDSYEGKLPNSNNKPFPASGAQGQKSYAGAQNAAAQPIGSAKQGMQAIDQDIAKAQKAMSQMSAADISVGQKAMIGELSSPWWKVQMNVDLETKSVLNEFDKLYVRLIPIKHVRDLTAEPPMRSKPFMFDVKKKTINHKKNLISFSKPKLGAIISGKSITAGVNQLELTQIDPFANAVKITRCIKTPGVTDPLPEVKTIVESLALTDNMGTEIYTDYVNYEHPATAEYVAIALGPFYGHEDAPNHDTTSNTYSSNACIIPGSKTNSEWSAPHGWETWTVSQNDDDDLAYITVTVSEGSVSLEFKTQASDVIAAEVFVEDWTNRRYFSHYDDPMRVFAETTAGSLKLPSSTGADGDGATFKLIEPEDRYISGHQYIFYVALHRRELVGAQLCKKKAELDYFKPQGLPFSPSVNIQSVEIDMQQMSYDFGNNPYAYKKSGIPKKQYIVTLDLQIDQDYTAATKMISNILKGSLGNEAASDYIQKFKDSKLSLEQIVAFRVRRYYLNAEGEAIFPNGVTVGPVKYAAEHIWLPGPAVDKQGHPPGSAPFHLPPLEGDSLSYEITMLLRTPDFFFSPNVNVKKQTGGGGTATGKTDIEASFFQALVSTVSKPYLTSLGVDGGQFAPEEANLDNAYQGDIPMPHLSNLSDFAGNMMMGNTGLTDREKVMNVGNKPPEVISCELDDTYAPRHALRFKTSGYLPVIHSWCILAHSPYVSDNYIPVGFVPNTGNDTCVFVDPSPLQLDNTTKYIVVPVLTNFTFVNSPPLITVNQQVWVDPKTWEEMGIKP